MLQARKRPLLPKWIKKPLKLLGIQFFNSYYCEKNLRESFTPIKAKIALKIRVATEAEKDRIWRRADRLEKKRMERARREGDTCLVALHGRKIAGYTWFSHRMVKVDSHMIKPLPKGSAFMFDSVVYPEYRGKKVFQNIISEVIRYNRKKGNRFLGNLVDQNNIPAIKARDHFISGKIGLKLVVLPYGKARILSGDFTPGTIWKRKKA